jgi:hypothetical protein
VSQHTLDVRANLDHALRDLGMCGQVIVGSTGLASVAGKQGEHSIWMRYEPLLPVICVLFRIPQTGDFEESVVQLQIYHLLPIFEAKKLTAYQ